MKFSVLLEKLQSRGVAVERVAVGGDAELLGISEDSRKTKPGDLFIARLGTKANGAQFIEDALWKGAVAVILQEGPGAWPAGEVPLARVKEINLACALAAHELAGNPTGGMKMIGITGTKGKTTVAYLLRSVLKAAGHKVGMIGTVEIDDGEKIVPADMTTPGSVELVELFSRMKQNGVSHCVMEVSSHALHQRRVAGIDFAVAIFTNLTGDHLDYHKTMEEYAAAKATLFENLKPGAVAIINADDKWAGRMAGNTAARVSRYCVGGETPTGGWSAEILEMTSAGMKLALRPSFTRETEGRKRSDYPGIKMSTPLVGRHNAANLLCAMAALESLGMWKAMPRLSRATGAPGRLQRVSCPNTGMEEMGFQVFVDYAHTHDAIENVLTALRTTMRAASSPLSAREPPKGGTPSLICVFGCGGDRDRTKRPKMGAIAERLADKVIVTSDNPRTENPQAIIDEICAGFSPGWKRSEKIAIEPDRRSAIRAAIELAQPGDVVLLAGKGHENYQIIGTTKHHFDDFEEAQKVLQEVLKNSPRCSNTPLLRVPPERSACSRKVGTRSDGEAE